MKTLQLPCHLAHEQDRAVGLRGRRFAHSLGASWEPRPHPQTIEKSDEDNGDWAIVFAQEDGTQKGLKGAAVACYPSAVVRRQGIEPLAQAVVAKMQALSRAAGRVLIRRLFLVEHGCKGMLQVKGELLCWRYSRGRLGLDGIPYCSIMGAKSSFSLLTALPDGYACCSSAHLGHNEIISIQRDAQPSMLARPMQPLKLQITLTERTTPVR